MPVDITDPTVAALAQDVQALNDFLFQQIIDGGEFNGLYRGFNLGDNPAFDWNMGGRLYNEYGGYQQDPKDKRPGITFNGVATAEIDITASHLTILHGLMGFALPAGNDPYAATDLPRKIAKAWIAMTLGDDHYHTRWTPRVSAALKESPLLGGKTLQAAFPIAKVRETILDKLPLLKDWDKNTTRWGQFQFIESEIIISTMKKLAKWHNCPALPVHDSIIVPQNKVIMAEAIFKRVFQDKVGIIPYVKIR